MTRYSINKSKQAGAELSRAQVKLEVIVEVKVKVLNEVVV